MHKNYYIYIHRNKINGKVYVGQTCQNPERRWRKGEGYVKTPFFYNAIKKYGWDNFSHEIIEEGLTQEEANKKEEYWIKYYNANNADFGYNLKSGGQNNFYSEESKKKMSEKAIKRFLNEEERIKQSERLKKAYIENPELNKDKKKKIQCIETGEIFESRAAAARWLGLKSVSSFGNYFRGESKTCGTHPITKEKLHWKEIE